MNGMQDTMTMHAKKQIRRLRRALNRSTYTVAMTETHDLEHLT